MCRLLRVIDQVTGEALDPGNLMVALALGSPMIGRWCSGRRVRARLTPPPTHTHTEGSRLRSPRSGLRPQPLGTMSR